MTQQTNTPERRLWNAVLLVAAHDAKSTNLAFREDVSEWVHSPDFEWVCENADQDVASTRQRLLNLLFTSGNSRSQKRKLEGADRCVGTRSNVTRRSTMRTRKEVPPAKKSTKLSV